MTITALITAADLITKHIKNENDIDKNMLGNVRNVRIPELRKYVARERTYKQQQNAVQRFIDNLRNTDI